MTREETRLKFWDIVVECLMKFHNLTPSEAHQKAIELRSRLRKSDRPEAMVYPSGMVYHEEPFYIACNLAGRQLKLLNSEYQERYNAILQRHRWEGLSTVDDNQ